MEDKRRSRRINFREAVQFQTKSYIEPAGCLACDLSESGIKLNNNGFIAPNEEMSLTLQLAWGNQINLQGRVVWVQRVPHSEYYQMGLEFATRPVDSPNLEKLKEYVQSH